jgi:hypothetical protein
VRGLNLLHNGYKQSNIDEVQLPGETLVCQFGGMAEQNMILLKKSQKVGECL